MLNGSIISSVIDHRPQSHIRLTLDIIVQIIDIIRYHIVICFISLTGINSAPGPERGCLIKGESSRSDPYFFSWIYPWIDIFRVFKQFLILFYVSIYPSFYSFMKEFLSKISLPTWTMPTEHMSVSEGCSWWACWLIPHVPSAWSAQLWLASGDLFHFSC